MGRLKRALPWLLLAIVAAFIAWKLRSSHFDWTGFAKSLRAGDFRLIALAVLVIYSNNLIRALRWSVFLRPAWRQSGLPAVPWYGLVGSQFIGFAGLAIFGRIGELLRPLLVARRTGLTFSSQVAVVTVERVFDLGAFGTLFAVTLLLAPGLRTLPYLHKAGYTIGGLTVVIASFVLVVRVAGEGVARFATHLAGSISKPAGRAAGAKVLAFRDGLSVIDSVAGFALATGLSFALWITIVGAYVLVLKAFPSPVHDLSAAHVIVLVGFSIAGSALPIPGGSGAWAGNVFALTQLFRIPAELAGSAGLMVWLVTSMAVMPAGLICAHFERISLAGMVRGTEQ